MLDKAKFADLMTGLFDMYSKVPSQFIFDTYYEIFKDYDFEAFSLAVRKCLKEKVYNSVPKPAEILEFLEGTRDDKALVGWLQLMEAVEKGGYYTSIEFADPVIPHAVNELGGWQWFCSQPKDELPFIQKRFMDLYRLFLKREISGSGRLIGWTEAQNNIKGYLKDAPPALRIGFEIKSVKELEHQTAEKMRGV
jgi:hypothetical protein